MSAHSSEYCLLVKALQDWLMDPFYTEPPAETVQEANKKIREEAPDGSMQALKDLYKTLAGRPWRLPSSSERTNRGTEEH